jgi:transposase
LELIMKKYLLKTSEDLAGRILESAEETIGVICVALDVEAAGAAVAVSFKGKSPRYFGKSNREEILGAVKSLASVGNQVICVQEACGFGYRFHRELQAAGVESLVLAPEALNRRRKTDKRDVGKLCVRLVDYALRDHRDVFKVVRAPSPEQERRRAQCRQRSQLLKTRNILAGQGRGLLQNFGHYLVPERWWGARTWPKLTAGLDPWIVEMLDPHRKVILQIEARMDQLEENTTRKSATLIEEPAVRGLGEHARAQMRAEVLDWHRFKNRSQVGSFMGCCPSEYSSGGSRRLGCIDRMGNKRLRCMLVEAVWRLHQWNQGWHGFQKFHHVLGPGVKTGAAARKKAIVACARLLAIDLWRIETGQIKPQDVGLILAEASASLPKAKPSVMARG